MKFIYAALQCIVFSLPLYASDLDTLEMEKLRSPHHNHRIHPSEEQPLLPKKKNRDTSYLSNAAIFGMSGLGACNHSAGMLLKFLHTPLESHDYFFIIGDAFWLLAMGGGVAVSLYRYYNSKNT
ncbi:MAG: hypothetical protein K2X98_01350 [Alphaproteobacteria bacterium]|nr:hypothetical protein [Alphaproteobacteria bacterium]